ISVLRPFTHSTMTSPPRPPSPPSGPPNSMNFSRRNETQPAPPSPERTYILAWSRNFIAAGSSPSRRRRRHGALAIERGPDRALKVEAVDIDHAAARRRPFQPRAGENEAAFLQHAPRGGIFGTCGSQHFDGVG